MILIDCNVAFQDYIKSLGKAARKNYRYASKHNLGVRYDRVSYPDCRKEVEGFMALWERQLIRGQVRKWAFGIEHLDDIHRESRLMVFAGTENGETIAMQFVEQREGFIEAHPIMYDKTKFSTRYLSKWMWFNLIKYLTENNLGPLNMGGGIDDWREMIQRREEFPNPYYKWAYIPENIKNNPDLAPNVRIENHALIRI